MSLNQGVNSMNSIKKSFNSVKSFVKNNAVALTVSAGAFAGMLGTHVAGATGPTADPNIATLADQVGGQFQVNIVSALTTVLPYVLATIGIFLAIKLGMRWMKKS